MLHNPSDDLTTLPNWARKERPLARMTYQDMNDYITRSIDVIIQAGRHEGARGITEFYLPVDPAHSKETAHV